MRLEGKVGIITAAASGMGRAGSVIFAREGASVAVVDRDEQGINQVVEEITQAGGKAFAIGADLRDVKRRAIMVHRSGCVSQL